MQFEYFCLKDSTERLVSEKLLSPVKCVDLTLPTLLRSQVYSSPRIILISRWVRSQILPLAEMMDWELRSERENLSHRSNSQVWSFGMDRDLQR